MDMKQYTHFSRTERFELSILRQKGYSLRIIAKAMNRSPSSVGRELKKNVVLGEYQPKKAHHKAYVRRKYSKYQGMKILQCPVLEEYIANKIQLSWSPEAIAGRWRMETGLSLHHTTIYKYFYSAYGQRFCAYLRYQRYGRKRRIKIKTKKQLIPHRIFIDKRPAIVETRRRYGDFEGDTMGVPKYTRETLVAIVERKSRYILVQRITRLKYAITAFQILLQPLRVKTLTLDNGVENIHYERLGISTYFCHMYSSWEKGAIENVFKLIREYIPKKASLTNYTDEYITAIVAVINNRPRKILGYKTPYEIFKENHHLLSRLP